MRRLAALVLAALAVQDPARGQDLEPRRWTHLPVGTNSLGLAYAYTRGDVAFDPVLELEDVTVESHTAVASYVRSFDVLGATGRLDLIAPLQRTRWEGSVSGTSDSRTVGGPDDPWVRLSVDFVGAPALGGKAFMDHVARNPVRTVVGAGIGVRLPLGDYDPDRLLNIGQNRFTFVPQVGVVHTRGPWSFELTQSTLLFTDNDDFFGGNDLEQDAIFALQSHVVRTFENQVWIAAGAGYSTGGESEVDGEPKDDERASVLVGCSVGVPLGQGSGLKLAYLHNDARRSVGSDLDSFVLGWTLRF